ncbi:MAG: DNA polymerase III subunit gamma/tau [Simkaniaceae bacterium]
MKSYEVIARKWRPQRFSEVVGQEPITQTLMQALKLERVCHAYLFSGLRGTGKTTLARLLAKALNCQENEGKKEPCNRCTSCREIKEGRSLDVIEIDGASNRGIDDIRQINESVSYTPSNGRFKIYIIDEVHMLTKEAFNALLKTLEEPPEKVKFFFATTEPHKILPTILSRTQRFDLKRIPERLIIQTLKTILNEMDASVDEAALALIASLSEGSLRDAESLLDQMLMSCEGPITEELVIKLIGLPSKEPFFALDKAILEHHLKKAFELSDSLYQSGIDLNHFIRSISEHFRLHLSIKLGGEVPMLSPIELKTYRELNEGYAEEHLLYILDYLIEWSTKQQKRSLKRYELEIILLHLIRSKNRISIESLFSRLTALEMQLKEAPAPAVKSLPPKPAPTPAPSVKSLPPKPEIQQNSSDPTPPSNKALRYETLLRFAGVELNGSVHKEFKE